MDFNDSGNDLNGLLVFGSEGANSDRVFATILLAILQLLINFVPSTILNSLILASYRHCKELQSPYNFLFVSFSCLSVASHVILFLLGTFVHPIAVSKGVCLYTHVEIKVQHLFVFSLPPLTITLIAFVQCYAILNGVKKLTYKRVAIAISAIWTYGLIVSTMSTTGYLYGISRICESVNLNSTEADTRVIIGSVFNTIDALFIDLPCFVLIIVATITSCSCFYKRSLLPSASVQKTMLFLPILMISFFVLTTFISRLLIPLIPILGHGFGLSKLIPILGTVLRLVSQSNSFLFAALFIGLQRTYREGMKTMLKSARMRIMGRACVRVVPVASVLEQDTSMTTMDTQNRNNI